MSNMVINTNVMALNSHRTLKGVGSSIAASSEKLSSGLRINRAADDAAGLAISEKMRAQIRGLDQASLNGQDGVSLIQTAEGALQEVENMLQRMRELVVKASNSPLEASDKTKITLELNQLTEEIDATAGRTEFNKKKLIDGSWAKNELYFQVGANEGQGIRINIANMDATWLGVTKGQIGDIVEAAFNKPGSVTTETRDIFNGKNAINFSNLNDVKNAAGTYEFGNGAKMIIDDKGVITTEGFKNSTMNGIFDTQNSAQTMPQTFETEDGLKFTYVAGPDNKGTLTFVQNRSDAVSGNVKTITLTNGTTTTIGALGGSVSYAAPGGGVAPTYTFNHGNLSNGAKDLIAKANDGTEIGIEHGVAYTADELKDLFKGVGGYVEIDGYKIKVNANGTIENRAVLESKPVGNPIKTTYTAYVSSTATQAGEGTTRYNSVNLFRLNGNNASDTLDMKNQADLNANAGVYTFGDGEKLTIKMDGTIDAFGFTTSNVAGGVQYTSRSGASFIYNATNKTVEVTDLGQGRGGQSITATADTVGTVAAAQAAGSTTNITGINGLSISVSVQNAYNFATGAANITYNYTDPVHVLDATGKSLGTIDINGLTAAQLDAKLGSDFGGATSLYLGGKILTVDGDGLIDEFKNATGGTTVAGPVTIPGGNKSVTFIPATSQPQPLQGKDIFIDNGGTVSDVIDFKNALQLDSSSGVYEFSNGSRLVINKDGTFSAEGFQQNSGVYNTKDGSITQSFDILAYDSTNANGIVAFRYDADNNTLTYYGVPKQNVNGSNVDVSTLIKRDGPTPGEPTTGNTAGEINFDKDTGKFSDATGKELSAPNGRVLTAGEVISKLTTRIDNAIEIVSSQRAVLGAFQNRLEYTIKSLDISSENLSASESRIRDTDMAKEMMNLTKKNVLSQAATSMLAQANQAPQNILQLLR